MKIDNTKAQMRKGILEYCILGILESSDAYASDIIEKLKKAKLIVVEGTLYPLLTRLKTRGFLNIVGKRVIPASKEILFTFSIRKIVSQRTRIDLGGASNRSKIITNTPK